MKKRWALNVLVVALVILAFTGCGVVTDLILDMRGTWSMTMEDFEDIGFVSPADVENTELVLFISEQKSGVFKGFATEYFEQEQPANMGIGFDLDGILTGVNVEMAFDFSDTPLATRLSMSFTGELNKFNSTMSGTYKMEIDSGTPDATSFTGDWTATKQ